MRGRARKRGAASCGRNPAQHGQIRLNRAGVAEPGGTGIIAQFGVGDETGSRRRLALSWERLPPLLRKAAAAPDFFVSQSATALRHHARMAARASDIRLYHPNPFHVLSALLPEALPAPALGPPPLAPAQLLIPQAQLSLLHAESAH